MQTHISHTTFVTFRCQISHTPHIFVRGIFSSGTLFVRGTFSSGSHFRHTPKFSCTRFRDNNNTQLQKKHPPIAKKTRRNTKKRGTFHNKTQKKGVLFIKKWHNFIKKHIISSIRRSKSCFGVEIVRLGVEIVPRGKTIGFGGRNGPNLVPDHEMPCFAKNPAPNALLFPRGGVPFWGSKLPSEVEMDRLGVEIALRAEIAVSGVELTKLCVFLWNYGVFLWNYVVFYEKNAIFLVILCNFLSKIAHKS